jgi:hypothetical protein
MSPQPKGIPDRRSTEAVRESAVSRVGYRVSKDESLALTEMIFLCRVYLITYINPAVETARTQSSHLFRLHNQEHQLAKMLCLRNTLIVISLLLTSVHGIAIPSE